MAFAAWRVRSIVEVKRYVRQGPVRGATRLKTRKRFKDKRLIEARKDSIEVQEGRCWNFDCEVARRRKEKKKKGFEFRCPLRRETKEIEGEPGGKNITAKHPQQLSEGR
jgi:hypothetical protein